LKGTLYLVTEFLIQFFNSFETNTAFFDRVSTVVVELTAFIPTFSEFYEKLGAKNQFLYFFLKIVLFIFLPNFMSVADLNTVVRIFDVCDQFSSLDWVS